MALRQSEGTAPLIAKLAEMMRYILYQADETMVPLVNEIAFVENYVEVERVRYRDEITINLETQGIHQNFEIAPLLLLPFIENAFKHGVQEEQNEGFVSVLILTTETELIMEVSNSIALKKSTNGGIGLDNVKKRLELIYPKSYALTIGDDGKVFKVNLMLTING